MRRLPKYNQRFAGPCGGIQPETIDCLVASFTQSARIFTGIADDNHRNSVKLDICSRVPCKPYLVPRPVPNPHRARDMKVCIAHFKRSDVTQAQQSLVGAMFITGVII